MAKSRKRSEPDSSPSNSPASDPSRSVPTSHPQEERRSGDEYRLRVEQRAYELYLSRGGAHGSDWEDWLAAERELIANRGDDDGSKR